MSDEQLVYTVDEAARILRIGRGPCYEAIRRGEVKAVRIGRTLRVPRHALEALLGIDLPNGRSSASTELHRNGAQAPERLVHEQPT